MFQDFKKFVMRGNVIDLAVGVIIGGSFGGVVKSIVDDIIMPPIGVVTGGVDFQNLFVTLKDGPKAPGPYASLELAKAAGASTLRYGAFLNTTVTFLIVAVVVFFLVRAVNKLYPPAPDPVMKDCPKCTKPIPEKASRCPECTADIATEPRA
jgi:large conductance mechanosensitive channel